MRISTGATTPAGIAFTGCANMASVFTFDAVDAHTAGTSSTTKQILISIGGSPYAIAVCAVGT
jgi:hypothetical protein